MADVEAAGPGGPERPVVIHPGFHKTGTTFLQNRVFNDERVFRPI